MLYLPLTDSNFEYLLSIGYITLSPTYAYYKNLIPNTESKVIYFLKSGKIGIRQRDSITTFEYQITLEQAQLIKILLSLGFSLEDAYDTIRGNL